MYPVAGTWPSLWPSASIIQHNVLENSEALNASQFSSPLIVLRFFWVTTGAYKLWTPGGHLAIALRALYLKSRIEIRGDCCLEKTSGLFKERLFFLEALGLDCDLFARYPGMTLGLDCNLLAHNPGMTRPLFAMASGSKIKVVRITHTYTDSP